MELLNDVMPKLVDEYLNELSYAQINAYVPSEFAIKFFDVVKLIEGGNPENKTPVVHYKFIDTMLEDGDTVNMCHRGFAKTTVKEYLQWFIAIFGELPTIGRIPYSLYVSDSMDNGVKKMRRSMEGRWNNSNFLQQYVPKARFTDSIWDFTNVDGLRYVITGHGAQTGVRGTRENNSRPVLALLDDLFSDTDAKSPTVIENVEATVYNAIEAALHPTNKKIIWSGTPFNQGDPLYKAVESGGWNVNVFPVCEKFPVSEEEFRGSWEERFTYKSILKTYTKLKASGKIDAFNQEYMLRIMSEEDKVIDIDRDIRWYERKLLLDNIDAFNIYITSDLATGGKTHNDFSVIQVWALNSIGQWFYLDGICIKQEMDRNIDDLFRLAQMYQPISVGIEVNGQQQGFIKWIEREMFARNVWFELASSNNSNQKGIRSVTGEKKINRFISFSPMLKSGKIYLPVELKESKDIKEALNELDLVTRKGFKSKHDDWIDGLVMLNEIGAFEPSPSSGTVDNDGNIQLYGYDTDDKYDNSYTV